MPASIIANASIADGLRCRWRWRRVQGRVHHSVLLFLVVARLEPPRKDDARHHHEGLCGEHLAHHEAVDDAEGKGEDHHPPDELIELLGPRHASAVHTSLLYRKM